MILEIKEAKKLDELNGLKDVIYNATVLVKEFDDSAYIQSCIDNNEEIDPSKIAVKVGVSVNLPAPSSESFTPLSEVTKETVFSWVQSSENAMKQISRRFDQAMHMHNSKANQPVSSTVEFK